MFSGVAIMVSEGCGLGHYQLMTAKGVLPVSLLSPGIYPPPLLQQMLLLFVMRPLPSPCLSNGLS